MPNLKVLGAAHEALALTETHGLRTGAGPLVASRKVVRRIMAKEGCAVTRKPYSSYRGEITDAPPTW